MDKYKEAWAGFVRELRRHGYWGDPEKYRDYFEGYFEDYLMGISSNSLAWHLNHCLDVTLDFCDEQGRWWDEWTDEDRKKVDEESKRLLEE